MENFANNNKSLVKIIASEVDHMRAALHPDNARLTEDWIRTMIDAIPNDEYLSELGQSYFLDAFQNTSELRLTDTLDHLSMAVRIAPRNSTLLQTALANRADALVNAKEYEAAIADYESNLNISEVQYRGETFKSIINVRLLSGDRKGSQEDLNRFVEWNRRRSDRLKVLLQRSRKSTTDMQQYVEEKKQHDEGDYHNEIRKLRSRIARMSGAKTENGAGVFERPYLGYTPKYPEIKAASVACTLVKLKSAREPMVLANRKISAFETIMVETPLEVELLKPNLQCDVCRRPQNFFIPCFDCHSGSYCSVRCKELDHPTHVFECFGMRSQIIPLLECRLLFRLVVRGLKWICAELSKKKLHLTQASEVFAFVCESAKKSPQIGYCNVFNMDPNLDEFTEADYNKCITTSVMLATFAMKHSRPIQDLCADLVAQIGSQTELFLGALILRHAAQLKRKVVNLHYELDRSTDAKHQTSTATTSPISGASQDSELNHKSISSVATAVKTFLKSSSAGELESHNKSDELSIDPSTMPVLEARAAPKDDGHFVDYVRQTIATCLHYATEVSYCQRNAEPDRKAASQRHALKMFVAEMFKFTQFKRDQLDGSNREQQPKQGMRCVAGSIPRLRHSCDPNAIVTLVSPNTLAVKMCRDVQTGDEITISYGVHFKLHNPDSRRDYLEQIMVKCSCHPCEAVDHFVVANSVKCQMCAGFLSVDNQVCPKCSSPNARLWLLLRETDVRAKALASANTFATDHAFDHYLAVLVVYVEVFGSASFAVFNQLRRIADWLSQQNQTKQTFDFIAEVCSSANLLFPAMSVEMFDRLLSCVEVLVRLLEEHSKKRDKPFGTRLRLLHDIHSLATDQISSLRRIASIRLLPKTRTLPIDVHAAKLISSKSSWPPVSAIDTKRSWRTAAKKNFVRDLYANVRQSKADTLYGVSTRHLLAKIFGESEEPLCGEPVEEVDDEVGTYIYYNTSTTLNWCDDVEMEENEGM